MAELNFPANPQVDDEYLFGNLLYKYDGEKWTTWGSGANTALDLRNELATNTGASMIGAASGLTVQEELDMAGVGTSLEPIRRAYAEAGFLVDTSESFALGGTLNAANEALLGPGLVGYSWGGTFPKEVPPNSNPANSGGVGPGAWIDQSNNLLRAQAKAYIDGAVGNVVASLTSFTGVITESAAWVDVPKHSDPVIGSALDTQTNALVARTELLKQELSSVTTLPDVSIFESAADNSSAIAALANNDSLVLPVHGELRAVNSSSLTGIEHLTATQVKSAGIVRIPGVYPELLGGQYAAAYNGGGQLSALNAALNNPMFQQFGIAFVGDSITWGTGSTGTATSEAYRDGTLSDPRNNADSCSYVNELRRWIKFTLGINTTEELSNHPYSPEGECISTFYKPEYCFPKGDEYAFTKEGVVSDVITENLPTTPLKAQRRISLNSGGTASLSFNMTGSSFTFIFGGLPNGCMYELWVAEKYYGTFSVRSGDDGIEPINNQRRKHTFEYVKNANISLKFIQYGTETGNNGVYIEGFLFEREIRVNNQGISGATTSSYLMYNFPVAVLAGVVKKLSAQAAWDEVPTGTGPTSLDVRDVPNSSTGEQRVYGYTPTSSWDVTFDIPAGNDRVIIGYSSLSNTGAIDVYADGVLAGQIHTSDMYPGNTYGYGKTAEVEIPNTTTHIKLSYVYEMLGGGSTCYIYLEGVGYRDSTALEYPDNNGFNDGVCLDVKDCFVFFQLGTNDRGSNKVMAPDEIMTNLGKMVGLLPKACIPIFMGTPPAETNTASHGYDTQQVRSAVARTARKLGVDFIDNHSLFGSCPTKYFTTDDLHPNDVGHALIAKNIIRAITCAA